MEHGYLLPEQVPLPESEDAFGVASFTMQGNDDPAEYGTGANRPKRVRKPTAKVILNELVEIENQLEDLWKRSLDQIKILQIPDQSAEEIRKAITEARSLFNAYRLTLLSVQELTASASSGEIIEDRKQLEETAARRKEFLDSVLKDANEQLKSLLLESQSIRSSSKGSVNSVTSTRLKAKAKAAAALKKAELRKHRIEIESRSAQLIEEEELALARRKRNEQAKLEAMRLDEEAAIALAKALAIDEELNQSACSAHYKPSHALDLPSASPKDRVQEYLDSRLQEDQFIPPRDVFKTEDLEQKHYPEPKIETNVKSTEPDCKPEVPFASKPNPNGSALSPALIPVQTPMGPYIEFMARRELISKKIEKFDDRPENYHTWKGSLENMIKGVNLSPSEQLSLIIEHTTNESKRLVQRLRNAYIENPGEGLKQVWCKLGERFGSNAVVTQVHLAKLNSFPKIGFRDNKRLQEFGDLLLELQCAKNDGGLKGLKILDEPAYLRPVAAKLPEDLQGRWQRHAFKHKTQYHVDFPSFNEFSQFIQEIARERNDPYLTMENTGKSANLCRDSYPAKSISSRNTRQGISTAKTDIASRKSPEKEKSTKNDPSKWCFLHESPHPLRVCRELRSKPYCERMDLLAQHHICFRCVSSSTHIAKDCTFTPECGICHSDRHVTALHIDEPEKGSQVFNKAEKEHGEEQATGNSQGTEPPAVTNRCTEVCGPNSGGIGRSCAKICLADVYVQGAPNDRIRTYVIIDDQSNYSLARAKLFQKLDIKGTATAYTLKTCSGVKKTRGRRAQGLVLESLDKRVKYELPTVTECDEIPNNREEIPTPEIARAHPHLRQIADKIPRLDKQAEILLLVGRDIPPLHKVHQSINGPRNAPWGQQLDLGWVVLGNTCLDGAHKPDEISAFKTQVLHNGRPSAFLPCPNRFHLKHDTSPTSWEGQEATPLIDSPFEDGLGRTVFVRTHDDNKPGTSAEDRRFMTIMENGMVKDRNGSWEAPLPLRCDLKDLPSSRENAMKRLKSTVRTLHRKPTMREQYFGFMQNIFDNDHAEKIPEEDMKPEKPCWYLPHFAVYHPKKPAKIRVVFDSAAECDGISLNKLLLSGPDMTNNLLGVLLRFRQNPVAIVADIEQMFHSFKVKREHRDLLRFLWFKDNDPNGEITEYRMKVHIFGNTSSPAVANHGLRKTAEVGEAEFGSDAKAFVHNNFYVDDGLHSAPDPGSAIDLLRRTQAMLATANLRLHKIASSHAEVMEAFPPEDHASGLYNLDFSKDPIPMQRSLGVYWDLKSDSFTFQVALEEKPFTRRGVLSVTNSLYDPLGLAAPVIIKGKQLLRSLTTELSASQPNAWDLPLPAECRPVWENWCHSLRALEDIKVPRPYSGKALKTAVRTELHTFCDASEMAIGAVSYLRIIQNTGEVQVAFVLGKAKLTPTHATTIPRLELCAAVLGVELSELINEELQQKPDSVSYYSDSKVVLSYISNDSRRFYVYVSNRVERIRRTSAPHQWNYVVTHLNPADLATRSVEAGDLKGSMWLRGPKFLYNSDLLASTHNGELITEILPDDPEVRKIKVFTTHMHVEARMTIGSERFSRFSKWSKLQGAIARLISFARSQRKTRIQSDTAPAQLYHQAKVVIIKSVQYEAFGEDIERIKRSVKLPKSSVLAKLCPVIDADGLLRVGGRLDHADLTNEEQHPIILHKSCHVSTLVIRHFHHKTQHQGRVFTHGLVRRSGFWIIGGKRLINSILEKCIKCKKLRGKGQIQKMADLPMDRVSPVPPFSYVGLDVFGPWQICARRTRGGLAHSKRWAVLFVCMSTRAIHIEVIESMDTSSFINALRRFLAIRGPVIQLRSDCGTNFVRST